MTPWRAVLYKELETKTISGRVLDIGGSRKSGYHERLQGDHRFEVVNIDSAYGYDHKFDIENHFPLADEAYDAVIAINVFEHIFDYQHVLSECRRLLKDGGTILIAVPFLMFVHPSPHDHWRYTGETLARILKESGFVGVEVKPLGRGPGAVFTQMVGGVRAGNVWRKVVAPSMRVFDACVTMGMSRSILAERFPLGYVIVAKK